MKFKKRHITVLFILVWCFSFSQNYTNYTITDGLPSNHVYTIRQDVKGFIWFITDKGMVKYNGSKFKQFTTRQGLPNNDVWEAFVTPDSKIWYLSKAAQLGYIYNDSVMSFPNETPHEIMNPIFSSRVNNEVYPTGPIKTHQLINGKWKTVQNNRAKIKVYHQNIKNLKIDKSTKSLIVYGKDHSVKAKFNAKDFIYNTKRGQLTDSLFFFINDKSYHILNLNTLKLYNKPYKKQLNKEVVKYVRINLVNKAFQISGAGFVGFLDETFNISKPYIFPKELNAHFGLIDASNTIWCATFNSGFYKIPYNKKDAKYSFLGKKIQSLDVVKNKLFVSVYDDGFYNYSNDNEGFISSLKDNGYKYKTQYIKELESLYYLSQGNVYSEKNGKQVLSYDYESAKSENNDKVRKLVFYNNNLFGLFAFGVNKLNAKNFAVEKEYLQKGTNDILLLKHTLYLATTNGLKVFKNDSIKSKTYQGQLTNKSILSLKKLNDTSFLINTDGFGTFVANKTLLTPLKGTEYLSVQDACVEDNTIWLATNKGVLVYENSGKEYVLKSILNTNQGLPINKVNTIAVLNDRLFIGTDTGLVGIPKSTKFKSQFLDVYIDAVIYNSEKLTNTSSKIYESDNNLNVSISTIDFSEESINTSFKYKLLPIQKAWSTSTTQTINYNNLQPKKYQFIVSKNGIEKSFSFTIKPLWWQTLAVKIAFWFLVTTIVLSGVWLLSKRIQKRKDQKLFKEKQLSEIQLRALRSQMNPHFVFNSLAAIQYYINENNFEASETYLVKFSKLIRQFFDLSKENQITLKEEIKLLKSYLEIEKLRFKDKLNFEIKIDKYLDIENTKIPTMILQPILENAVNHGVFNKVENGNVDVIFESVNSNTYSVKIIDDGVGFINAKQKSKKHNSSNVIADKLRFLNQTGHWKITFENKELNSKLRDKGNQAIYIITKIN